MSSKDDINYYEKKHIRKDEYVAYHDKNATVKDSDSVKNDLTYKQDSFTVSRQLNLGSGSGSSSVQNRNISSTAEKSNSDVFVNPSRTSATFVPVSSSVMPSRHSFVSKAEHTNNSLYVSHDNRNFANDSFASSSNNSDLIIDKATIAKAKTQPFLVECDKNATLIDGKQASKSLYIGQNKSKDLKTNYIQGIHKPSKEDLIVRDGVSDGVTEDLEGGALNKENHVLSNVIAMSATQAYQTSKGLVTDSAKEGYVHMEDDAATLTDSSAQSAAKTSTFVVKKPFDTKEHIDVKRENKIIKLETKADKFGAKTTNRLKKSEKLERRAQKAKKAENFKREEKLKKKAKKKRGAALKSGQKAQLNTSKANITKGKRSLKQRFRAWKENLFSAFSSKAKKILLIIAGALAIFLLSLMLVGGIFNVVSGAMVSMLSMFESQSNMSVSETEAYVARYLRDKGFSEPAIAGIMGNAAHEGGWVADRNQDGGGGYGLFQFDDGNKTGFYVWCNENNRDPASASAQLDYMFDNESESIISSWGSGLYESGYYNDLIGTEGWDGSIYSSKEDMKSATDVVCATASFMMCYERCATGETSHLDQRIQSAWQYLLALMDGSLYKSSAPADANDTVKRAYEELGKPYVWGAVGPDSYDCSGLVSYCLAGEHVRLGNTNTFMGWERVSDPQPGDVITNSHHCGIVIGNGQMIHAPTEGDVVKISDYGWMLSEGDTVFVRYSG